MSLEGKKTTRRAFLGGVAAMGIASLASHLSKEGTEEVTGSVPSTEKPEHSPLGFLEVTPSPKKYDTGRLSGRKFSGLLTSYTGIKGPVPREALVDFRSQLARMWKYKLERIHERHKGHPPSTLIAAEKLFTSYDPERSTKMNILQYQGEIGKSIQKVRADLPLKNIQSLPAFKSLDKEQVSLVEALEKRITAMSLLGYSLTEIMPTTGVQSVVGIEVYDWLLRSAGREYLEEGMPALGDAEFSFGLYQLTPGVFVDPVSGRLQGARLIDSVSKQPQTPRTIGALRGGDHHRAAYLFAVHNLALLVRRLNQNRSRDLLKHLPDMPKDLVTEFIAAAHHSPANAINGFEVYLQQYEVYRANKNKYAEPDFVESCASFGNIGPYARKTRDNMKALRTYFAKEQVRLP